ncbi:MAG TPA: GNAT family protein [Phototrophicaceae bacterium]|nr:GNAT family protein [Phototrophicaceae bacterium]
MILETERLLLRPLELRDAPTICDLAGDYDIAATTLNIPHPYPEGAAEELIQSLIEKGESANLVLGIVRKADQQLLGMIDARPNERHQHAELGYWIGKPYWNQGYASEAARRLVDYCFAELGLQRVYASYFSQNIASRRVMEKAGMTYEGTLREHLERFGKFQDIGCCGILRREWEARQS